MTSGCKLEVQRAGKKANSRKRQQPQSGPTPVLPPDDAAQEKKGAAPMTKAKTKASRRRQAKSRREISLPGAEPATMRTRKPADDPRKTALQARCRIAGTPDTTDAHKAAASPLYGAAIGLCIMHHHPAPAEQAKLWATWQAMSSAHRAYRMRIIGQTGDPKGAAIGMIPDAMQSDDAHTIDIRTAAERDADAKSQHNYWAGLIKALPNPVHHMIIRGTLDGFGGPLWQDAAPTTRGTAAVAALVLLTAAHARG